jgi:glutamate N-acetyltransferase/amino-acid N-acetyltransferase
MIHPQLATLLSVITTDVAIDVRLLNRALQQSVARSFSRLSIDGDSSPNDSIYILANGAAEGPPISDAGSWEFGAFQEALDHLCADLSQQIVRDAAGNGKMIQVTVRGATNDDNARKIALAVVRSSAVRAACRRGAPDWGTILAAIGASGAELRPELLELRVSGLLLMQEGLPVTHEPIAAVQAFSGQEIHLVIDLHLGPIETSMWTCTWSDD